MQGHGRAPRRAGADGCAVEPRHRHDAARRTGEEDLVGASEFDGRQSAHLDGHLQILGKFDHGTAGDAFEHAAIGRDEAAAAQRKDVETRAFRDVALGIGKHRHFRVALVGLEQRHGHVEPVEVLDARIDRLRRDALHGRYGEMQAAAALLLVGDPHEGLGERRELVRARARVAAALGRDAARARHLHVGILQAAAPDTGVQDGLHLIGAVRDRHAERRHGAPEALDVVVEAEEAAVPDMDHVIGGIGAHEAAIHNGDRLSLIHI